MPIKNYTTEVPANRSISQVQEALVNAGASGIHMEFARDKDGENRVCGISFVLELPGGSATFRLPARVDAFQKVLFTSRSRTPGKAQRAHAYRVAWRCIRDWVLAQIALCETDMVTVAEVFFPYIVDRSGRTVFELVAAKPEILGLTWEQP